MVEIPLVASAEILLLALAAEQLVAQEAVEAAVPMLVMRGLAETELRQELPVVAVAGPVGTVGSVVMVAVLVATMD